MPSGQQQHHQQQRDLGRHHPVSAQHVDGSGPRPPRIFGDLRDLHHGRAARQPPVRQVHHRHQRGWTEDRLNIFMNSVKALRVGTLLSFLFTSKLFFGGGRLMCLVFLRLRLPGEGASIGRGSVWRVEMRL